MEVKKQDETGHFSNGIQCAAMARDTNTRVLLSRFRVSDVALPNSILIQNTTKIKLFINVYNAAHETLNLLGQGGYRSSSTTCFINCLNITFMRVFKDMTKNIDKK